MVLVAFDRKNWFWVILAGKTGFLLNNLVLVGVGRQKRFWLILTEKTGF